MAFIIRVVNETKAKIKKVNRIIMTGAAVVKECLENNTEVLAFIRKGSKNANRPPKSELLIAII